MKEECEIGHIIFKDNKNNLNRIKNVIRKNILKKCLTGSSIKIDNIISKQPIGLLDSSSVKKNENETIVEFSYIDEEYDEHVIFFVKNSQTEAYLKLTDELSNYISSPDKSTITNVKFLNLPIGEFEKLLGRVDEMISKNIYVIDNMKMLDVIGVQPCINQLGCVFNLEIRQDESKKEISEIETLFNSEGEIPIVTFKLNNQYINAQSIKLNSKKLEEVPNELDSKIMLFVKEEAVKKTIAKEEFNLSVLLSLGNEMAISNQRGLPNVIIANQETYFELESEIRDYIERKHIKLITMKMPNNEIILAYKGMDSEYDCGCIISPYLFYDEGECVMNFIDFSSHLVIKSQYDLTKTSNMESYYTRIILS